MLPEEDFGQQLNLRAVTRRIIYLWSIKNFLFQLNVSDLQNHIQHSLLENHNSKKKLTKCHRILIVFFRVNFKAEKNLF